MGSARNAHPDSKSVPDSLLRPVVESDRVEVREGYRRGNLTAYPIQGRPRYTHRISRALAPHSSGSPPVLASTSMAAKFSTSPSNLAYWSARECCHQPLSCTFSQQNLCVASSNRLSHLQIRRHRPGARTPSSLFSAISRLNDYPASVPSPKCLKWWSTELGPWTSISARRSRPFHPLLRTAASPS